MAVKHHVFEFEILFVLVFMDEGCLELSFLAQVELLYLDLLREIHSVLRHPLEDGLFGAPVDRELLVLLLVMQIVDFVLREGLLLYGRDCSRSGCYQYLC